MVVVVPEHVMARPSVQGGRTRWVAVPPHSSHVGMESVLRQDESVIDVRIARMDRMNTRDVVSLHLIIIVCPIVFKVVCTGLFCPLQVFLFFQQCVEPQAMAARMVAVSHKGMFVMASLTV